MPCVGFMRANGKREALVTSGGHKNAERTARERARAYEARQEFHAGQKRRRIRDNVTAGVAGGLLIAAVVAGQIAYFTAGPGVPEPTPSETPVQTPVETPTPTPTDTPIPTPTPSD